MQDNHDNRQNDNRQGVRRPTSANKKPQGRTAGSPSGTSGGQKRPVKASGGQTVRRSQTALGKNGKRPAPKKRVKRKKWKIALFVAELFIICILVGLCWAMSKVDKIQHVEITETEKKEELAIDESIAESEVLKGYRNIALFGVDSRDGQLSTSTRTDTIMIASINLDTKEVRLASVYRDTWLNMSTDKYSKANAAYSQGGYKQAMAMLNMNLDLDIEDFVTIGFQGLIDVIDAVGGIDLDEGLTSAEATHTNSYQISMVGEPDGTLNGNNEPNYTATPGVDYTPVSAGQTHLNGLQATAYARVRYVGSDIARASRQRLVLTKVAQKAMTLDITTLNKIADAVFPEVLTSLSLTEILELLKGIASYEIGEQTGFPFEGYINAAGRVGSASVVVPIDLTKNVSLLHEFLFDEEGYEPSDTVKRCSEKIASDTGEYYSGD